MAVGDTLSTGDSDLRDENIQRAVTGFAQQQYRFKSICTVESSSSWKETFFKEMPDVLTASGTRNVKGVSRLANFPNMEPTFEENNVRHLKHAAEAMVSWEDANTNSIDIMRRTLIRVAEAITKSVDDAIYAAWIADSDIGTGAVAAGSEWDSATKANRDPIENILTGIQTIDEYNYNVQDGGFLLLNPKNYKNLLTNSKVINNPSFKTADVVSNGRVGRICDLTIVKSNSVPADEALIIKGKTAATWKTASPLKTKTIEDFGIKFTIRAWEIGVTMVTNPRAIYRITNTDA